MHPMRRVLNFADRYCQTTLISLGMRIWPSFKYLKTPIGTDSFVESYLDERLGRQRGEIKSLSDMTHLHECFTLLRSCASACKVTHLMRTIPPRQLKKFLNGFDSELRKAMGRTLRHDLNDDQGLICQLPAKYCGFGLRSGKLVAGAQHLTSLTKCWLLMQMTGISEKTNCNTKDLG